MLSNTDKAWIDGYLAGLESSSVKNDQSLHTIDEESKDFINWTAKHLSDTDYFSLLSCLVDKQLSIFLNGDRKQLLCALLKKLYKGAQEHGKPSDSQEVAQDELKQEFLDILGWNMVMLWNKRGRKKC